MCEPVSAGLVIGGAAISAYGQYEAGRAQKKLAGYNRQVQMLAAADALERGKVEESRHRRAVRRFIGRQRAVIGGSGIAVDEGSAGRVVEDAAMLGELDALTIRNNAARAAWGYQAQADITGYQGELAAWSGRVGALGSLVGGTAQGVSMLGKD